MALLTSLLKKIWNDPVWSKVIAALIIGVPGLLAVYDSWFLITGYLNSSSNIKNWFIAVAFLLFLFSIVLNVLLGYTYWKGKNNNIEAELDPLQIKMLDYLFDQGEPETQEAIFPALGITEPQKGIFYLANLIERNYVCRIKQKRIVVNRDTQSAPVPVKYGLLQKGRQFIIEYRENN